MVLQSPPPPVTTDPPPTECTGDRYSCVSQAQQPSVSPEIQSGSSALRFSSAEAASQALGASPNSPQPAFGSSQYLRLGSRGPAVQQLQQLLSDQGFNPGPVDGILGSQTDQAVRLFQQQSGLTVDGIVGPATWQELQPSSQTPDAAIQPTRVPDELIQPDTPLQGPHFSNPLPKITLHPIQFEQPRSEPFDPRFLWLSMLTLTAAGVTAYGVRQTQQSGDAPTMQPPTMRPIYRATPVYPARLRKLQHAVRISEKERSNTANGSFQSLYKQLPFAAAQPPQWAFAQMADHLENFVFDLLEPSSRHQLASQISADQHRNTLNRLLPFLPVPFNLLGVFPLQDETTGEEFRYSLVDDLGGCFMITKNQLWLTREAQNWLLPEEPYVLTIRCHGSHGSFFESQFTVVLPPPEEEPMSNNGMALAEAT